MLFHNFIIDNGFRVLYSKCTLNQLTDAKGKARCLYELFGANADCRIIFGLKPFISEIR